MKPKLTTQMAIDLLCDAWQECWISKADPKILKATWNEICEVLGFADRFKL